MKTQYHPIVEQFIETEKDLKKIIQENYDRDNYLEKVLAKLFEGQNPKRISPELLKEIDEAVIKGHANSEVYILFLLCCISICVNVCHNEKAESLFSLLDSVISKKDNQLLLTLYTQAASQIQRIKGNFDESRRLMTESMKLIDETCIRYRSFLRNYAHMLAMQGMLKILPSKDLDFLNKQSEEARAYDILEIFLANTVITADANLGFTLIEKFESKYTKNIRPNLEKAKDMLHLLSGENDDSLIKDTHTQQLFKILQLMKNRQFEVAEELYKQLKSDLALNENPMIDTYLPLHFEFNRGNKGKILLTLKEKEIISGKHYLDDFFYGRLQLLDNKYNEVEETFSRLIKNIQKYGSMNRLIFEMQFAQEMNLNVLLRLSQGWPANRKTKSLEKQQSNENQLPMNTGVSSLIGSSNAIIEIKSLVKKFAAIDAPVLISGETGTGKELIAEAIHKESKNHNEPFLAINCGALTDTLLQSELFGYVAGAFTGAQKSKKGIFEAAGRGTVFLDEFGDISPKLQVSLLRVLEVKEIRQLGGTITRKIECKIVVAVNNDLKKAVEEKKFREDLYFRLARFEIKSPPLRERKEDIPKLIQHFLNLNNISGNNHKQLTSELLYALTQYNWPGNVRELKNEIDKLFILNPDKSLLQHSDFDFTHLNSKSFSNQPVLPNITKSNNSEISDKDKETLDDRIKNSGFKPELRIQKIKDLFHKYEKLTRNQIMTATQVSPATATKDLQILCELKFIKKICPTKSPRTDYFQKL